MEELNMLRTSMFVTEVCNLKCKLCSPCIPYNLHPHHLSVEDVAAFAKRYFEIVSHVKKFTLTGGEHFLNPSLPDIILHFEQYRSQYDVLELVTNATIYPSEKLLAALNASKDHINVFIDNYGSELSVNFHKICELFEKNGIPFTPRENNKEKAHCDGWVDYGDLTVARHNTQEAMEKVFAKCALPNRLNFCFVVSEGKMYPCAAYRNCVRFGSIADHYDEYIDVFDDSLTVEQQRQKIKNIYSKKSLSACAYCDGMCEDSKRYVPAEQLTKQEMHYVLKGARSYHEVLKMMDENNQEGGLTHE